MQPIIISPSRKKWIVFLIVGLTFVATGILLLFQTGSGLVPWTTIIFFGGCSVMFLWQLFDNRPRITISEHGIDDRFLKTGCIEWSDIERIRLWRQQGNAFIALELRDESKYIDRLSPLMQRAVALNRKLGFPSLSLNLAGTDAVPEQVETLLQRELAARSRDAV